MFSCFVASVFFVLQEQRVRHCGSLLILDEVRTRVFQNTRPQELLVTHIQHYDGFIECLTPLANHSITAANNC